MNFFEDLKNGISDFCASVAAKYRCYVDSVTDDKGVISGVYKDGYHFDELIDINKDALRYEVDGDNLILYYPMARILKTIRKKGVTYSKKIILEENN